MSRRPYYPVLLDLDGRGCIVVGGGAIAEAKVQPLVAAGARVTVIAPALTAGLAAAHRAGRFTHRARPYAPGDLADAFLAISATDDPAVNHAVHAEAEARGIPVNVVDDPAHCGFILPSIMRRGELVVAVSTSGNAPALAVRLRERIERELGDEYGRFLELAGTLRAPLAARYPDLEVRKRLWYRLVDSDVLALLRAGDERRARERIAEITGVTAREDAPSVDDPVALAPPQSSRAGAVYLVGAGPGDPKLITARGLELVRRADVVVYDRLVRHALLDEAPPDAELVFAGKTPNGQCMPQEGINALLVSEARLGKVVVRLKGGDPFVFGRGFEEALACAEAGVPCEVVPGVSSVLGVTARASIPVTSRGHSASFAVVTAHRAEDGSDPVEWGSLAGVDTLVVLMGVERLADVMRQLQSHGRAGKTPVAVIENGTLPEERVIVGTLDDIVPLAEQARVRSPALIVVGAVVRLRAQLAEVAAAARAALGTRHVA